MDSDTLKSLLTLVAWVALFFMMMRYGCGVHMMGRHGRHQPHAENQADVRDPVCGMTVQQEAPSAAAVHQGRTYYFCSRSCRDKFEASPERYAGAASQEHQHA
jgi:YHS domain-containing protein